MPTRTIVVAKAKVVRMTSSASKPGPLVGLSPDERACKPGIIVAGIDHPAARTIGRFDARLWIGDDRQLETGSWDRNSASRCFLDPGQRALSTMLRRGEGGGEFA